MKINFIFFLSCRCRAVVVALLLSHAQAQAQAQAKMIAPAMSETTSNVKSDKSGAKVTSQAVGNVPVYPYGTEPSSQLQLKDPFEPFNRVMFDMNIALDGLFVRPITELYKIVVPSVTRQSVTNVTRNLSEPLHLVHNLLQFKFKRAGTSFARFFFNTIFGFCGIMDVATTMGFKRAPEDLGQSLGNAGMTSGPYLVLPLLGPSSFRDILGTAGDFFIDPVNYAFHRAHQPSAKHWRFGAQTIAEREAISPILDRDIYRATDPYTRMKVLYMLHREKEVQSNDTIIQGPQPTDEELDF